LCTVFMAPVGLIWMILGFLLFRIFDIWKPWPIREIDAHMQGGLGIMLDDILAAIPAWCILQALVWGFHR
jgi:phosphatidylglycerophosphatase A